MPPPSDQSRNCPPRADGAEVLIAHTISLQTCQDRQRGMYHKCYSCSFNNTASPQGKPQGAGQPPARATGS